MATLPFPKLLLVLAHPETGSFCHSLCQAVLAPLRDRGAEPVFLDLYRDGFDPVMDTEELRRKASLDAWVNQSQKSLSEADQVVLVGPEWWGSHPAIMKGWLERCLRPEIAYRHDETVSPANIGLLGHQKWLLCMSSDGESAGLGNFRHAPGESGTAAQAAGQGAALFPGLDGLGRSLASGCGIQELSCLVFAPVRGAGYRQRQDWIRFLPRLLDPAATAESALPQGAWLWKHVSNNALAETACQEEPT